MGSCLSKCDNKLFTLRTPLLTSGHLRKAISVIQKSPVEYFDASIHRRHGYERLTQSINSSLMDLYDRFSTECLE